MTLTADDCLAAETAIHHTWLEHAEEALQKCIDLAVPFSADVLHAFIPEGVQPHHPNAIGPFFKAAQRAGRIKFTGRYVAPNRASRHGNPNKLWIGGPN